MPILIRSALIAILLLVGNTHACLPEIQQSNSTPTTPQTEPDLNIEPCLAPDGYLAEVVLGGYCFFEDDGEVYDVLVGQDWSGDEEPLQYIVKVGGVFVYVDPGVPFMIGHWKGELTEEPQTMLFEGKQVPTTPKVRVRIK